ncbi:hypothetical protein E7Z59_13945 [Robertkochia marina]|uniref:Uncharacterized protein n=1 Tax=Robertkochia marina TaxID=1227945 RepID=A0A4V3UXU6_9FLAO|nr:hypothetical protein [Robertkochia marina]THD65690.1 hypothetical protein E7Z59_13945 [Robertkochia marina]TRZ46626.1 hypothetical protein D3A96_03405 [Robertkochia marina]
MSTCYYHLKHYTRTLCVLAILLIIEGCGTVGPKKLPGDQFDFNSAINEASSEQLLLNMVRLRYSEQPTFLKVSSIVNQYTRSGTTNILGGTNDAILGTNIAGGGAVSWSNTPTISYLPISGQEFSRNLLTPLPPGALLGMIQSGWPIELVMKTTIWSVNGIFDEVARPSGRRFADPELYELFELWQYLIDQGMIGLKRGTENTDTIELFFQENNTDLYNEKIIRFKDLLNLDDDSTSYIIKYGLIPENQSEIAMITGSVWEIMLNLSWYFDVPPSHITNGRTMEGLAAKDSTVVPPINVLFSEEEPEAHIKIYTQEHWFYIDNNDRNSKRYFSFLQLILNLSENQTQGQGPALTIPTN